MEETKRDLGIYIHIPFCSKKCDYCDFLSGTSSKMMMRDYFEALLSEIDQYRGHTEGYLVPTIFIGGGTPSLVDSFFIERIMNKVEKVFQIDHKRLEATIEINPGTITKEKLQAYQRAGINRISFGLQSASNEELKLLGRIHTYEQFEQNYDLAREMGFHNINIDLMSALPGQTLESWEETLNKVMQLEPEHISAYSLIIEEGTKFYERYQEGTKGNQSLPDEEVDRLIYHRTKEVLQKHGYLRYEISNYAKKGSECRHNMSYWIGTEYLGLGLGASSYYRGARFSNLRELDLYIESGMKNGKKADKEPVKETKAGNCLDQLDICCEYKVLTKKEQMEEFMFLGLRVCSGVKKSKFMRRFLVPIETIYGEILQSLQQKKLIVMDGDNIKLTEFGIDISNYVLSEFLMDES